MEFEMPAPPPPAASQVEDVPITAPARPTAGYEATNVAIPAPTPGVTTYRLRGTETSQT